MKILNWITTRLSSFLETVAGFFLVLMMLLTAADVIMRAFGSPIRGTYELISFGGGLVISLAQVNTFRIDGHVSVDTITSLLPSSVRFVFHIVTKLIGLCMFLIIGWSLTQMGLDVGSTGETSAVLKLPFSALIYAMAGAFFASCLALFVGLRNPGGEQHE
jgi:TRAP-type C4-dicarboxylate transport system permease small subunit